MTLDLLTQPNVHQSDRPQPASPLPAPSASNPLSTISAQPLTWLWPQRIPSGKLTLLDGSPGCGTSLFTLNLAACVSAGLPLPDGTSSIQGPVLLIAPHDSFRDTIKPRLQAAGADLDRIMTLSTVPGSAHKNHLFSLPRDLALLESIITSMGVVLVIIDPYSAIPGLRRYLQDLIQLARHTHCAILLTRSLTRPPADPLRAHGPASPVLTAARSHLLLTPDPADERHCLLLTPKHTLCAAPSILAYQITATQESIPTIHWSGERDRSQLSRLCTGPIRSLHRQAILRFLHESSTAQSIKDILSATSYDYEAGRKMLVRMQAAGELVSPARGLYTTLAHPCLAQSTNNSHPVSTVPNPGDPASDPSNQTEQSEDPSVEAISPTVLGSPIEEGRRTPARGLPSASTSPLPLHACMLMAAWERGVWGTGGFH